MDEVLILKCSLNGPDVLKHYS